jgi:CDP-glucose 4,6-dehydratase
MAAQPLVLESFQNPHETFEVNVMGTVNVLDVAFKKNFVKAIIVVTTDKVYKNDDSRKSFIESDPLEGKDPYSASKVGCESVVSAWQQIAKTSGGPKVVTVRAGNVIGGGDYGKYRLIPDAIRSYLTNKPIYVRNPESTRPWQHVLDPLSGYLQFIEKVLFENCIEKTLNFGPNENSLKVRIVIEKMSEILGIQYITPPPQDGEIHQNQIESKHLSLNTNKALEALDWIPTLSQLSSIEMTTVWWQQYFSKPQPRNATKICRNQILEFLNLKFKAII